jgi:diacylglycerol kinase
MPKNNDKNILKSFRAASRGLKDVLRMEPTFKYMVAAAMVVVAAIFYFDMSRTEIALLILISITMLALEVINTLFEKTLDIIQPQYDEQVRRIKDLMSGLVLLASIGAAALGILILLPHIARFF